MTSCKVETKGKCILRFDLGDAEPDTKYDAKACTPMIENIEVKCKRLPAITASTTHQPYPVP